MFNFKARLKRKTALNIKLQNINGVKIIQNFKEL